MSITRVQFAGGNANSTTLAVTIAAATAGNLLVAVVATGATTSAGTCATPTGYTLDVGPITNTSAVPAPVNLYIFHKIAAGGETSFTATDTVSSGITAQVWEWSASTGWPASPVDVSASSANQAATTTPVTGTTATTAQAEELWIGGMSTNLSTQITYSLPTNSFTLEASQWAGASAFFSPNTAALYRIASATGTASTGVTSSTSKGFAGAVVAFKDNPAGGGGSIVATSVLSEPSARIVAPGTAQSASTLAAPSAQVVTSSAAVASASVLSEPSAQVLVSGDAVQANATLTHSAQLRTLANVTQSNSLVTEAAQVLTTATSVANSTISAPSVQINAQGALSASSALVVTGGLAGVGGGALSANSVLSAPTAQMVASAGAITLQSGGVLAATGGVIGSSGILSGDVTVGSSLIQTCTLADAAVMSCSVADVAIAGDALADAAQMTCVVADSAVSSVFVLDLAA